LVLNVLRGLCDRYSYLRTWITRQRPFPTFMQVRDDLAMEELTQGLQPGSTFAPGSSSSTAPLPLLRPVLPRHHSRQFLVLFPPGRAGLGGPWRPPSPWRGTWRRSWGQHDAAAPMGCTLAILPHPWSGRISMWPFQAPDGEPRPSPAMLAGASSGFPSVTPWMAPPASTWPGPTGWDQAALAHSFSTMALTPPVGSEWIADSGATYHTTPNSGILSSIHPPSSSLPSSIMVANGYCLPVLWVPPAPMVPFIFLTFLLLLLWFTTFFQFVFLQLTILVLWSLTLLVLL